MCGIAGYLFNPDDFISEDVLVSAKDMLVHRGPDDFGFFNDPEINIGFTQTRLSILDPSPLGHQPMVSEDGRVVLIFNGEIYNFRELRKRLEDKGQTFKGHSDTEVLLKLYLDQRQSTSGVTEMLQQLNGIFAFALWDYDAGALLIARDAVGVKPLYYSSTEDGLAFASEIKALLPLLPVDTGVKEGLFSGLDPAAIDRYLTFLWCPGQGTPASSIKKLGPGQAMWVRDGVIVEDFVWYRLPVFRASHTSRKQLNSNQQTKSNSIDGVEKHLRQAVHRQMVSDVPVGAFLSGGLDSSAVVTFAREINPDIDCFTIDISGGTDTGTVDDLPFARQVAEHLKVKLEVVSIKASDMAMDLEAMVSHLDEPLADPAALNVLYISQLARESGIKVLLSGVGGDDLFTGYRRHRALKFEHFWTGLPLSARKGLQSLSSKLDKRTSVGRRLSKLFDGASLEGDARLVNYFVWSRREDLEALYSPEFRLALDDSLAASPMFEFLSDLPIGLAPLERMLALEQRFFLTDHNLIYNDKMSMVAGVEVRVPFLDLDLIEYAQKIPMKLKQRGGMGKWVLKKAMEPYLPKNVIYRPKSGFGAPLRHWMRYELRELLQDVLSEDNIKKRGIFKPEAVRRLFEANNTGKLDASYTLFSLLCIEIWCSRFLDKQVSH